MPDHTRVESSIIIIDSNITDNTITKVINISEPSRLEFLEKFLANNFALSDAEDNTFRPLNRRGIVVLPLLRTLLGI